MAISLNMWTGHLDVVSINFMLKNCSGYHDRYKVAIKLYQCSFPGIQRDDDSFDKVWQLIRSVDHTGQGLSCLLLPVRERTTSATMNAANGKKKDHKDVLARLVRDLKSKKTLCRVKDYAGVSLEQLNQHVKKIGPLVHPTLGEQPGFFVNEGRFVPFRMVVFGRSVIGPEIITVLKNWAKWTGHGGRVTNAQGEYVLDGITLRVPDVAYVPEGDARQLTEAQRWNRGGEPFAPTFVVEIDTLTGPHSKLDALDHKMWREYFPHGVQLGWLIDPKNKIMYEYKRYARGNRLVRRVGNSASRDLDGGTVLPGFTLNCEDLDDVLDQESGSSSEEEVDLVCPVPACGLRLRTYGECAAHAEWHRAESARARKPCEPLIQLKIFTLIDATLFDILDVIRIKKLIEHYAWSLTNPAQSYTSSKLLVYL
ncbi:putative restriction endonuclease type II [Plasmopara halstedii]